VSEEIFYTYKGAAQRARRSVRTIKEWRRDGMKMTTDSKGRRVVSHTVLLATLREKLENDPVHQQRGRKQRGEDAGEGA